MTINEVTNSLKQNPFSEMNSLSASQGIPHLLWTAEVHYQVHTYLALGLILSHKNPVHNFT
jgi:hypothetical protein